MAKLPPRPDGQLTQVATPDEQARRRYQVLTLSYQRRLTEADIAKALRVSVPTIKRDLRWWRDTWAKQFGPLQGFDAVKVIGETIAFHQHVESTALEEFTHLQASSLPAAVSALQRVMADPASTPANKEKATELLEQAMNMHRGSGQRRETYAKLRCLKVAQEARVELVRFLQDLGLLDRHLGTLDLDDKKVPGLTGIELMQWLRKAQEDARADQISDAEKLATGQKVH